MARRSKNDISAEIIADSAVDSEPTAATTPPAAEEYAVVDGALLARAEKAEAEVARLKTELARNSGSERGSARDSERGSAYSRAEQKISILRLIFIGIAALMGYLGILVLINWYIPGSADIDGIGATFFQTSKDILLVLTGILGSAMASVFDSRSSGRNTDAKPVEQVQAQENNLE
jgi:hypothetical protein